MKLFKHSILMFCLAACCTQFACSDDSSTFNTSKSLKIGDKCKADDECPANAVCKDNVCTKKNRSCDYLDCDDGQHCENGKCVDNDVKCGDEKCADNQTCQNGKCVDLCGNEVCPDDEICQNDHCIPSCEGDECDKPCTGDKCHASETCANKTCSSNQVCHKGECREPGDCGGAKCDDDETCSQDICRKAGDCAGLKCEQDEICAYNLCLQPGNCGGVTCPDNMLCDIPNDICRNPGDCGGIDCGEDYYCHQTQCFEKEICGDTRCEGDEECIDDVCVPSEYCLTGKPRCGTDCCTTDQFCGTSSHCCNEDNACGNDCCVEGQVCDKEKCHIACGENIERCAAEDGTESCCQAGEICTSYRCFLPKTSCVDDYQCENDEYCESTEKICLPQPTTPVCEAKPSGGAVQPTLLWYWGETAPNPYPNHAQVMSSPMVADINNDTIPEVAFNSYETGNNWEGHAYLRILNGQTGELLATSNGNPMTDGGSMVAVGNLDDDPYLEIVTCAADYRLVAYKFIPGDPAAGTQNQLQVMWHHSEHPFFECGQSGPGIADFNGDGKAEVYGRYTIHDGRTGDVIVRDACEDGSHTHIPCDYSVALDVNNDEKLELVGGNVVYQVDIDNKSMSPLWKRTDHIDGYPAVANIDLDPENKPELVVVRNRNASLMVFDAQTGSNFWPNPVVYSIGGGGTPTIANVNDTPEPEIAFAGVKGNVVLDYTGKEIWARGSHDTSSGRTGSSVFDFDGDGKAEIVYADEYFLRVYDGITSKTRFCQCNTTCTHYEYPVIADVNADGHAEILISANTSCGISSCNIQLTSEYGKDECVDAIIAQGGNATKGVQGVRAFASPTKDWVNTRKIYNQHAYNVTNVSDNGSLPTKPRNNWSVKNLNNFRLNVQPGATYLPDLSIQDITSPRTCQALTPIYFNVTNVGWAAAEPGITVHIWASATQDGEYVDLGTVKTSGRIRPTEYEPLNFMVPIDAVASEIIYLKLTFDDTAPTECRSDNDDASYMLNCTTVN